MAKLTLEELNALNDEMLALVRAHVPLPHSLRVVGRDISGAVGKLLLELGETLESGESLETALQKLDDRVPPIYSAVVAAGVRTGRLPIALESIAIATRHLIEMRRTVNTALTYPLILFVIAYGLSVAFLFNVAVPILELMAEFRIPGAELLSGVERLANTWAMWVWVVPTALALALFLWLSTARANVFEPGLGFRVLSLFPILGRAFFNLRIASFCRLLQILIHAKVPLTDSLRLAGRSSGAGLRQSADALASAIEQGVQTSDVSWTSYSQFPPLVTWTLAAGHELGNLEQVLMETTQTYYQRGLRQLDRARLILPGLLLLAVGASVTLMIALMMFLPLRILLEGLANPA